MKKSDFVKQRQKSWQQFERMVRGMDKMVRRKTTPEEVGNFSRLFREVCYDLAIIRSRDWGRGLSAYLNDLVIRGHNAFYCAPPGNMAYFVRYLLVGFPRMFRKNIGYFCTSALLFFLPLAIAWAVVHHDPELAKRVIETQQLDGMEKMYDPDFDLMRANAEDEDEDSGERAGLPFSEDRNFMAGYYVNHNVGISFQVFALGILMGVGTVYTLLYNGIVLGAVAGYVTSVSPGHSHKFLNFVVSHGSFELTAIAVSGGTGLMLADAIIHPGRRRFLESLATRGLEAVQIAMGAAAMLVIAAGIEAFWSPLPIPDLPKNVVAICLWLLVAAYLGLSGLERNNEVR